MESLHFFESLCDGRFGNAVKGTNSCRDLQFPKNCTGFRGKVVINVEGWVVVTGGNEHRWWKH